jgi:hypothetical protein
MRRLKNAGIAAVLSAGFVTLTIAAAPGALATTPATHTAPTVRVAPADFESGYREGYKDGRRDGKNSCKQRSAKGKPSSTDRGYAKGYVYGFNKSRREFCGDEG